VQLVLIAAIVEGLLIQKSSRHLVAAPAGAVDLLLMVSGRCWNLAPAGGTAAGLIISVYSP